MFSDRTEAGRLLLQRLPPLDAAETVILALPRGGVPVAEVVADGLGARVAGDPLQYVGWLMMLSALFYTPAAIALRGVEVIRASRRDWIMGMIAAAASFAAYAIAVWVMTVAPLALVAALRETSILFAVLLGWLLFGDKMDKGKAIAAVLIVSGVVLTRI